MVECLPLRGLLYAAHHTDGSCFAPPYDVIDARQQRRLLERNPFNVVRLILGQDPTDAEWHAAAAATLRRWTNEGVLQRDPAPAFYGYRQTFALPDGSQRVRAGLLGRVCLREWGDGIHRHERTRVGPRADRLRLMRAARANLSPVFGLYPDPHAELVAWLEPPAALLIDYVDDEGVRQQFWRIADPEAIQAISQGMAQREVVIADGHHRYETALAYRAERRAAEGDPRDPQPYDYVLMYLCAAESSGLCILPTHRVITQRVAIDAARLFSALSADFEIVRLESPELLTETLLGQQNGMPVFGLCLPDVGAWTLRLRDLSSARRAAGATAPVEVADLDVSVLQNSILTPHLGITPDLVATDERVAYTIDAQEACTQVAQGQASAVFVLNPTTVAQVFRAARAGVTMPQKSTYFYPKLLTGLVLSLLDDSSA
jgi:uncharacterized protein (DUF1015 family)